MKIKHGHKFEDIICLENLLEAWSEFIIGKKKKKDVEIFARNLMDNILSLHTDLANKTYKHGGYHSFYITDPKRRHIHKASVRDRLVHHAIHRKLYPFFDKTFIPDSYSCRVDKGTHRAVNRFRSFAYKESKNHIRTCWVLKCDIKKFFASIDHWVLLGILNEYIADKDIIWLLENIIDSFYVNNKIATSPSTLSRNDGERGLPLGNLTSQLFSNIYMNKLDQYMKHKLKIKYYIRYADDFVILSGDKGWLEKIRLEIENFLQKELKLLLHPDKVFIKTYASGVDFLGWNNFCDHRILRKKTKERMFKRIEISDKEESLQSYLGLISHGNSKKLKDELLTRAVLMKRLNKV